MPPAFYFKQFTAVDVARRYRVGELYSWTTARCTEFERVCQARQIPLIVPLPHSPRINSRVAYVPGAYRREFYECTETTADLEGARR